MSLPRSLIIGTDTQVLATLKTQVAQVAHQGDVQTHLGAVSGLGQRLQQAEFDIVIIDLPTAGDADLTVIEAAIAAKPQVSVILRVPEASADLLLRAMRTGIREVIDPSATNSETREVFRRQYERQLAIRVAPKQGSVLAFVSAKGGSGATFLASSLGYEFSLRGRRVAVIDLNLHFGDAAMHLSEDAPPSDIAQLAREIGRLDADMLRASMLKASDNLWVLAAPESPERATDVDAEAVQYLLDLARTLYDVVIVDVGRHFDLATIRALDSAESVHVVLRATFPALHNARRMLKVFDALGYDSDKIRLVLNGMDRADEISLSEIEKTLGRPVSFQVPNSPSMVLQSVNRGEPLARLNPKDPVVRAVASWANGLAPLRVDSPNGWLRGMFGSKR
jgi:pilus assembly protein CpaE